MIGISSPKELVPTVLQLYLIWTLAQILEHIIEFQRRMGMEFFVTLVDGWRLQTNNTKKTFILDVAMVLETSQ